MENCIIEDKNELSKAEEYRKSVAQEAKEIRLENMPRGEAIISILKQYGLKDEIANNKDAVKAVLEIANDS